MLCLIRRNHFGTLGAMMAIGVLSARVLFNIVDTIFFAGVHNRHTMVIRHKRLEQTGWG